MCRCTAPCTCDGDVVWGDPSGHGGADRHQATTWRDVAAAFAAACQLDEFGTVFDAHHGELTAAYQRWVTLERFAAHGATVEHGDAPDPDDTPGVAAGTDRGRW